MKKYILYLVFFVIGAAAGMCLCRSFYHSRLEKAEKDKDTVYVTKTIRYSKEDLADKIENQSLAEIIVDWCVNSGMVGLRKVQEIVGCKPDGIAGPITLSLINTSDAETLFDRLWKARYQFYINIVKRNPSQKVFMNGWMNRLNSFKFEL